MQKITTTSRPGPRHALALATVALAAAGLAACGEDDAAASPAEYREQANSVCAELLPRVMEALPDLDEPPTPGQVRSIAAELAPVFADLDEQMSGLEAPAELRDGHDRLLAEIRSAREALRAVEEDEDAAAAMAAEGPPLDGTAGAMEELGLDACNEG